MTYIGKHNHLANTENSIKLFNILDTSIENENVVDKGKICAKNKNRDFESASSSEINYQNST